MNRKAFTIIELLTTIAIISLLSTIGIISYTSIINQSAARVFEEYQDSMFVAASNYLTKNYSKPGVNLVFPLHLTIDQLGIETFKNPRDSEDNCKANSEVIITKDDRCEILAFKYSVCLNCNESYNNCKEYFSNTCS